MPQPCPVGRKMRCLQCELDNRDGRKFCARCGGALGWTCGVCGFANAPDDAFCGGCGRQAERAAASASPAPARTVEESAERRQVTILFADLCGFTALSAQL